nr:MAG: glycoprotein [Xiaogan peribunya-like virus 1]
MTKMIKIITLLLMLSECKARGVTKDLKKFQCYKGEYLYSDSTYTVNGINYTIGLDEKAKAAGGLGEYGSLIKAIAEFLDGELCPRHLILLGGENGADGWAFGIVLGNSEGFDWGLRYERFDGFKGLKQNCDMPCEVNDDESLARYGYCILSSEVRTKRSTMGSAIPGEYLSYEIEEGVNDRNISKDGVKKIREIMKKHKAAMENMNKTLSGIIHEARDELQSSLVHNIQFLAGKLDSAGKDAGLKLTSLSKNFFDMKAKLKIQSEELMTALNSSTSTMNDIKSIVSRMIEGQDRLLQEIDKVRFGVEQDFFKDKNGPHESDLCSNTEYQALHPCTCDLTATDSKLYPSMVRNGFGVAVLTCKVGGEERAEIAFRDYSQRSSHSGWGSNSYLIGNDILDHQKRLVEAWQEIGKPQHYPCEIICLGKQTKVETPTFINHYYKDVHNNPQSKKMFFEEVCQCVPNTFSCSIEISDFKTEVRVSLKSTSAVYKITYDGSTTSGFVVGSDEFVFKQPESGKKVIRVECNMNSKELVLMHSLKEFCDEKWKGDYMTPMRVYCKNARVIWSAFYLIISGIAVVGIHKQLAKLIALLISPPLAMIQSILLRFITCNACRGFKLSSKRHNHIMKCIFCGEDAFLMKLHKNDDLNLLKAFRKHRMEKCLSFRATNRFITAFLSSFNLLKFVLELLVKPGGFLLIIVSFILLIAKTDAFTLEDVVKGTNSSHVVVKMAMSKKNGDHWTMEAVNRAHEEDKVHRAIDNPICDNYFYRTALMVMLAITTYFAVFAVLVGFSIVKYCSVCFSVGAIRLVNRLGFDLFLCKKCISERTVCKILQEFYRDEISSAKIYRDTTIDLHDPESDSSAGENIYTNLEEMKTVDKKKDSGSTGKSEPEETGKKEDPSKNMRSTFKRFKEAAKARKLAKEKESIRMESLNKMNNCHSHSTKWGQLKLSYWSYARILFVFVVASSLFKPTFCLEVEKNRHRDEIIGKFLQGLSEGGFEKDNEVKFHKQDGRADLGIIANQEVCNQDGCVVETELNLLLKGEAGLQFGFLLKNSSVLEEPVELDIRVAAAGYLCNYVDQYETFPVVVKQVSYAKCTGNCDDIFSLMGLKQGITYFNHSRPYDSDWNCNGWCFSQGTGCTAGSCWCEPAPGSMPIKVKKLVKQIAVMRICINLAGVVQCASITEDKLDDFMSVQKISEGDDECPSLIAEKPDGVILEGQINHLGEFSRKFGAVQKVAGKIVYADNSRYYRDCHFGYERKIVFEKCCLDTWFLLPTLNTITMHKRSYNGETLYYKNSLSYVGTYNIKTKMPKFLAKRPGSKMEVDSIKILNCEGCSNCKTGATCEVEIVSSSTGLLGLDSKDCMLKQKMLAVEAGKKIYQIGYFCSTPVHKTELYTTNARVTRTSSKDTRLHDGESLELGSQAAVVSTEKLAEQGCTGLFCWGSSGMGLVNVLMYVAIALVAAPIIFFFAVLLKQFCSFFRLASKKIL